MSTEKLRVKSPVDGDRWSWSLVNEEGIYHVDAHAEDGLQVRLATVRPDLSGSYSRNQVAMAMLVVGASSLASHGNELSHEFALRELNLSGCRLRGDEVETVQTVRDAARYLYHPDEKPQRPQYLTGRDTPTAPWTPFARDFQALEQYWRNPLPLVDGFPIYLPFRVGPSSDARGLPWGEICDARGVDVFAVNSASLTSSQAEPQAAGFLRAVEVAPHLLVGSLRLVHAAQMERDLYPERLRRDELDSFQLAGEVAEREIGELAYPSIVRVLEGQQMLQLVESRSDLALAAAGLLRTTEKTPQNSSYYSRLEALAGGLVRSEETRAPTRDELDAQGIANRGAAELALASGTDVRAPTVA